MTRASGSNGKKRIEAFQLKAGDELEPNYVVRSKLGSGWEGEVYLVREKGTGIERAAKLFFPHRNVQQKTSKRYAKKLHKLRDCPSVIQYHSSERLEFQGYTVIALFSDYIEGIILNDFIKSATGRRLSEFQALHLLYALACGLEPIHMHGEYHGDLHSENVIVRRYGLGFDLKFLDFFHWGPGNRENRDGDVYDIIKIFYEALGGRKYYARQSALVKSICCGLRRQRIKERFRTVGHLKTFLENMTWE